MRDRPLTGSIITEAANVADRPPTALQIAMLGALVESLAATSSSSGRTGGWFLSR
jgi:hypothetical protein